LPSVLCSQSVFHFPARGADFLRGQISCLQSAVLLPSDRSRLRVPPKLVTAGFCYQIRSPPPVCPSGFDFHWFPPPHQERSAPPGRARGALFGFSPACQICCRPLVWLIFLHARRISLARQCSPHWIVPRAPAFCAAELPQVWLPCVVMFVCSRVVRVL
jgi:hypothetical protein